MTRRFSRPYLVVAAFRAIALIMIAWGLTQGIVNIIDGAGSIQLPAAVAGVGVVVRAAMEWLGSIIADRDAHAEKTRLRLDLADRIVRHGRHDLDIADGELAWLGTSGLDGLDDWYEQVLPAMSGAAVIPLAVGLVIGVSDWVSGLILLLTLPLVPVFMWLIGTYTEDRVAVATDAIARLSAHVVELARGLPALVGLHRAAEQAEALDEISRQERTRTMQVLRTAFLSSLALELISTLSVAMVAVFVGVRLVHGSMTLAEGLFVLVLAPECFTPLRQLGAAYHAAENGTEVAERVQRIIASVPADIASPAERAPILDVNDLTITYRDRAQPAVTAISFHVAPGEVVSLAGPSGCGKSTVLAALAGVVTDGEMATVTGSIAGIDPARLAYVAQHPMMVTTRVADELAFAGAGDIDEILTRVNAGHLRDRAIAELSLGELRRVAVARALVRIDAGADTLLLDEPTAHLDARSTQAVHAAIASLPGHVRTVLVSHAAATRAMATRTVAMGSVEDEILPEAVIETAPLQTMEKPDQTIPTMSPLKVIRLLQPDRWQTSLAIVLGVIASLCAVALTALSGWLIVRASEQPPIMYLLVAIVGVRFFGIGRAVFRYLDRLRLHDVVLLSIASLRGRLWRALANAGPRSARWLQPGASLDILVGQLDTVRDLAPRVLVPPVVSMLTVLAAVIVATLIYPLAGLLILVLAGGSLALAPLWVARTDRLTAEREATTRSELRTWFGAMVSAAADVRGNGLTRAARTRLATLDARLTHISARGAWAMGGANALTTLGVGCASVGIVLIGSDAVNRDGLAPTLLAVLVLVPLALIEQIMTVVPAVRQWPSLRHAAGTIQSLIEQDEPAPPRSTWPISSLALRDVSLRWPNAPQPAVEHVSIETALGDWWVLTGPSGSGKSTIFAAIMGFLSPSAGEIVANGDRPLGRHARVSWCPQEAHIFDSTVRGNLLLARPRKDAADDGDMWRALAVAGLADAVEQMPQTLDTRVGPAGSYLSGGQRQRLAIARALLVEAGVVLLDEPTAHLDTPSARLLLEQLAAALDDRIVLQITHDAGEIAASAHLLRLGGIRQDH